MLTRIEIDPKVWRWSANESFTNPCRHIRCKGLPRQLARAKEAGPNCRLRNSNQAAFSSMDSCSTSDIYKASFVVVEFTIGIASDPRGDVPAVKNQ